VGEQRIERRLAAILAADVAGYSRLMGANEVGTLRALKTLRKEIIDPALTAHGGRVVKLTGDGILIEFSSAVDAVACAVEVQRAMARRNADVPPERRIEYRAGVNIGDVIVEGEDIYGDGVNVAARLRPWRSPAASGSRAWSMSRSATSFPTHSPTRGGRRSRTSPARFTSMRSTPTRWRRWAGSSRPWPDRCGGGTCVGSGRRSPGSPRRFSSPLGSGPPSGRRPLDIRMMLVNAVEYFGYRVAGANDRAVGAEIMRATSRLADSECEATWRRW
jgi:hypothetical protein